MNVAFASSRILFRKSLSDVTRRKGRTLIVVISIFIGVFGLTVINVFGFKITNAFAHQLDTTHFPDIVIAVDHVDPALITQIKALPNVQVVQERMTGRVQWQTPTGPVALTITAFQDLHQMTLGEFEIINGRYPGPHEIVMELGDLELQSFSLNQIIQVQGPNAHVQLHIVGTVQTSGLPRIGNGSAAQGYMRMSDLGPLLGRMTVNSIAVKVRDVNQVSSTAQELRQLLHKHFPRLQSTITISQNAISVDFILGFLSGFFNLVRVLAVAVIIVSCFLIMSTLTTLIAEQMRVIGTLKAIGGTQGDILKSYLLTVLIYSVLGTFAGLALGITIGYAGAWEFLNLKLLYPGPFAIPPNVFLTGIGAGIGAPCLAAILVIVDGTRIPTRAALGAYGVTSVSANLHRFLPDLGERLVWMSQTVWLGLRGIFRKRGRAMMTISALALSGITFLTVMLFQYSLDQRAMRVYEHFPYDISVSAVVNNSSQRLFPLSLAKIRQRLDRLPNVARVEREDEVIVSTPWGMLNVEGVDADTQIYTKPILAGRWFLPSEQGVCLLDQQTVQRSHLSIDQTLTFTDGNGHNVSCKMIGIVDDEPNQVPTHGVIIISADNLEGFLGRPADSVSLILIQARDHSPASVQNLVNQVDQVMQTVGNAAPALTKQDTLDETVKTALNIGIVLYTTAFGVALAGLLGLYNTLTSSVLERQREIGVWRSMGASNWQVSRVFWIEGLALAGLAWLVGALIGPPLAYGFDLLVSPWLVPVPFAFNPWSLPLMLLALIVIATVASFGPTARASRARVAEILRYE
jgi:putative ABC transport system permease protein